MTKSKAETAKIKINRSMPYVDICRQLIATKESLLVPSGLTVVSKKIVTTKFSIIECTEANEFALVVSMSHAIVDGRSYYEILKMLSPNSTVRPLNVARIMDFPNFMREACGKKELEWADTPSCQAMYTFAMMPAGMGCGKITCTAFYVDDSRLKAAKTKYAQEGNVPYVTTNDILTSIFFMETKARIGMMGMDCRNRFAEIDQDRAGNYVTALTMDPTTFATPSHVKKMLDAKPPYVTTNDPLPSFCSWLCGQTSARFAMATNWASFAGDLVAIDGCELVVHLPVKNPDYCVYDLMIPFMASAGKVGVLCYTTGSTKVGLREALPVGDVISKELFPNK